MVIHLEGRIAFRLLPLPTFIAIRIPDHVNVIFKHNLWMILIQTLICSTSGGKMSKNSEWCTWNSQWILQIWDRPGVHLPNRKSQLHWSDGSILMQKLDYNWSRAQIVIEFPICRFNIYMLKLTPGLVRDLNWHINYTISCSHLLVIFPLTTFPKLRTKWSDRRQFHPHRLAAFVMSSAIFGLHLGGVVVKEKCLTT